MSRRMRRSTKRRSIGRRGMSLIEVMIALVILSISLLGLGDFVTKFVRGTRQSASLSTAGDLAVDRIELVKGAAAYGDIEGYAATEAMAAPYAGFTRTTEVLRVGGGAADSVDFKRVTVVVAGAGLVTPIKKTTYISSF